MPSDDHIGMLAGEDLDAILNQPFFQHPQFAESLWQFQRQCVMQGPAVQNDIKFQAHRYLDAPEGEVS